MAAIIDYRGKTPTKTAYGVPLVTAKIIKGGRIEEPKEFIAESDFDSWMRRGIPEPGDIVLTTEAPLGEIAQLGSERVALAQRVITLRGKDGLLDNTFLLYLLQSNTVQEALVSRASGTTVVGIKQSELRKVELLLPPIPEQKRIAHILGTLDDKIELNRRMNRTMEAMAQAIFKSWFVDFEPVKAKAAAKAAGASPEEIERAAMAAIAGKSEAELDQLPQAQKQSLAQTAALFPDELAQVEDTLIPESWKYRALSEVFEINPKRTLKRGSHVPYLDMNNVSTEGAHPSDVLLREFKSGTKFQNGDTLLARITPCIENGKTAFVNFLEDGEIGWGSTEFIVIRPRTPFSSEFGYHVARWPEFRLHAIQSMVGTSGRQRVSPSCFETFSIAVPPDNVAAAFGKVASDTMQMIRSNALQSQTLAETRDALLPKLLSGELGVNARQADEL